MRGCPPALARRRWAPGDLDRLDATSEVRASHRYGIIVSRAIVVGAGPNGLAAAIALAQQGVIVTVLEAAADIGGGTRTAELIAPGVLHDVCSAVHPFGVASPFLRSLDLQRNGLRWLWPDVDLAHPLDGGRAGVMVRSLVETVAGLGSDGHRWRRLFGPLAVGLDNLTDDVFRPILHFPDHPLLLARFGSRALQPATAVARRWDREETKALFGGVAAHSFYPLGRPTTAAAGLMLIAAGHHAGWPVAEGGSQAIANAMAARLVELGGAIESGVRVRSLDQLPPRDAVMLDVSPRAAAEICGDRLPSRVRRAYRKWRYGAGAFKVDLVVEGGVPWAHHTCRRAGTLHVGGTIDEIAAAEREVHQGGMPKRPFVLVAQQYLADPSRSSGDLHPIWAYGHVPHGYTGDATDAIIDQIERFAPGLRDRIVGVHVRRPGEFESYNANYIGGDIATGANDPWQVAVRPRLAVDPYRTGIPGVYLCSAATPPGAGVHGMCGFNAAQSALRFLGLRSARSG
jgi:phytoene dehydrogenase-like protein